MTETTTILSQDCQYPDRDINHVSPDCDGHTLPLEPAWLAAKICIFVSINCANEVKVRMDITVTNSNPKKTSKSWSGNRLQDQQLECYQVLVER